jgi:hypothetical protein
LNYEIFLHRLNTWGANNDRTVCFDLWLGNSGTAPAQDVDIFLSLPPSLKWVAEAESGAAQPLLRPEPPQVPERPHLDLPFSDTDLSALRSFTPLSSQIAELLAERTRDVVEVWSEGERGFRIHGTARRLKHGEHHRIGPFLAVFGSWGEVKPFEAEYKISASELAHPEKSRQRAS